MTNADLRRLRVRTRLRGGARRLLEAPHWVGLRKLGRRRPDDYRDYLSVQLKRTLSKRDNDPGVGAVTMINRVAEERPEGGSVLCVGCRNPLELDRFHDKGFDEVVGVDLFSQRPDILVMDMHELSFADDAFDVVYASHALEHAYDVARVVRQIVRVAREGALVAVEVPVRVQASTADRIVFAGLEELRRSFEPHVAAELLAEEQPPRSPTNEQGTEIARLVFRLRK